MTTKKPIRVAVTGAAGNIGYSLLFRIAAGELLGPDQPVILQLLEIPVEKAQQALKGVAMELEDCAFPLLQDIILADDPKVAFKDVNWRCSWAASPAAPAWSAPTCSRTTARSSSARARPSTRSLPTTRASRWWATPATPTR